MENKLIIQNNDIQQSIINLVLDYFLINWNLWDADFLESESIRKWKLIELTTHIIQRYFLVQNKFFDEEERKLVR